MPNTSITLPFRIMTCADVQASDGRSRYGAYLRRHAKKFDLWDEGVTTDPAEFAAAAWEVATSPIMSPGYVEYGGRILSVRATRTPDTGGLLMRIELAAPARLFSGELFGGRWNSWVWDRVADRYGEPSEQSQARRPSILTVANVLLPISRDRLYAPHAVLGSLPLNVATGASSDLFTREARRAVEILAALLNEQVTPVLAALEGNSR